jgi:arsenite-transporting ATPase
MALPELMGAWISGLISRREKVNVLGKMWRNVAGAAAGSETERQDPVLAALKERQARFDRARTLITDPKRAGFVFVVTAEHLPVAETERSVATLEKYGIPVAGIIVNQVVPEDAQGPLLVSRRDQQATYVERVGQLFGRYPVHQIPLLDGKLHGMERVQRLVGTLPASERDA